MTRKKYVTPIIEDIKLDNEISLQLASNPTIDQGLNLKAPAGGRSDVRTMDDPYQYEGW